MSSLALSFQDVKFDVVDRNGQPWLKSSEIAAALGYADEGSVSRIYRRNADEFTACMTQVIDISQTVNLTVSGNLQKEVRIFSLRGCHLLAMFARTAVAKEFRKWVLDVLDREAGQSIPLAALPKFAKNPHLAIKNAVLQFAGTHNTSYSQVYKRLYNRFQVEKYQDIPEKYCDAAIQYIRSLEGEYMPRQSPAIEDKTTSIDFTQKVLIEGICEYLLSNNRNLALLKQLLTTAITMTDNWESQHRDWVTTMSKQLKQA